MNPESIYNQKVEIQPYNSSWPVFFDSEAHQIKTATRSTFIDLQHVGSTSIPKLSAKPIIDILGVVEDLSVLDRQKESLEDIGYLFDIFYFDSSCRFLYKRDPFNGKINIHFRIYEKNDPRIKESLFFRDHLKRQPYIAAQYGRLKKALAEKYPDHRDEYQNLKSPFINVITSLDKPKEDRFRNDSFEYGIDFTCDCFPNSRFQNGSAGKRSRLIATATFSNPLYSKILYFVTWLCSETIGMTLSLLRWADRQTISSTPKINSAPY